MDHYEGMSIIELGLLRMEDIHHNLVIAQANEDR